MRRLIFAFVVRIWLKQVFSWRGSFNPISSKVLCHKMHSAMVPNQSFAKDNGVDLHFHFRLNQIMINILTRSVRIVAQITRVGYVIGRLFFHLRSLKKNDFTFMLASVFASFGFPSNFSTNSDKIIPSSSIFVYVSECFIISFGRQTITTFTFPWK